MIMTDNLKKTLVILLDTYKEDKIDKEDILTILETILNNNCSSGTNVISYPVTYPYYKPKRNWWDWWNDLPQWTITCTSTGDIKDFKQSSTDDVNIKSNV